MNGARGDVPCVVWSSALFNRSGYAEEARENILALDRAGVRVYANPTTWMPWQKPLAPENAERLEQLIPLGRPERFVHVMHYGAAHFERRQDAIRHVGRTMWETDSLPPDWVPKCNEMDEIWVPSDFNVETFARAGVIREKLHKIPEGLQPELYEPIVAPLELDGVSGFVFLSVFSWSRRKAWDVLVRAYLDEFSLEEDVTLAILVTPFSKPVTEHVEELKTFIRYELGRDPARSARLTVLDFEPGSTGMPRLYRAADAYVQPSRSEGWGRPLMEAMACGLPAVGTRWSGNLEFMTGENSYLLDYELTDVSEAAWREWPWFRGQQWAEPSVEHLRSVMRRIFEYPDEARTKGACARRDVLAQCTWRRVAETILDRLRAVESPAKLRGAPPARRDARHEVRLHYEAGAAHRSAGRNQQAEEHFVRAILRADLLSYDGDDSTYLVASYIALARLLLSQRRWRDAVHYARRAFELAPDNADAYVTFAAGLAQLGLFEGALRAYRRAFDSADAESGWRAAVGIAEVYLRRDQRPQALEWLATAAALAPENADVPTVVDHVEQGRAEDARRHLGALVRGES
jgi:glycosyltransferase involved in cell wall biosynthesis